ncbi:unnamed protein product [Callosobruchus maculatus]|uniref:THAP-type domain-containing protein n=1 Tax=Callosobruchus maculatus TaxID=64391 RepID=A0A653DL46_CALMS|nr:unnamed protein product [Callosobruchus maculatus]
MPSFCCVVNCSSRGNRDMVNFYRIPSVLNLSLKKDLNELSKRRREKWLQAIKREDLTEVKLKYARVCSKHFVSGKPADLRDELNIDWVPTLLLGHGNEEKVLKRLKLASDRTKRVDKRRRLDAHEELQENLIAEVSDDVCGTGNPSCSKNDKSCQTRITTEDMTQIMLSLESTKKIQAKLDKLEMGYKFLKDNDLKTKYFTGINSFKKLEHIFNSVKDHLSVHFNSSLSTFDQFLLTLVKLRLNYDFKGLAYHFGISPTTASTYFKNTINVMYAVFHKILIWPERDVLKKTMPRCFKETFGDKVTVIVDCFELYIEKPSNLQKSAQCWSNYKHHHTVKYLIGITPQGSISFISEAWGGRASDKHITIHSEFLNHIIPGDVILADRGFLIEEHVRLFNAQLHMPAFTKGKKQLHPLEIEKTRSIAHVRIHVERVIGCIRQKFTILSNDMPISLLAVGDTDPIIDKVVTVCCALINLCPPIVPME